MWILLSNIDLCCFVARQFLSQIYALLSEKFPGLKMCECKKNDKYQVCNQVDLSSSLYKNNQVKLYEHYCFGSYFRNIARIANAVQVTLWMSVTNPQFVRNGHLCQEITKSSPISFTLSLSLYLWVTLSVIELSRTVKKKFFWAYLMY